MSIWRRLLGAYDWAARADFGLKLLDLLFGGSIASKLVAGALAVLGAAFGWITTAHLPLWERGLIVVAFIAGALIVARLLVAIFFAVQTARRSTGASAAYPLAAVATLQRPPGLYPPKTSAEPPPDGPTLSFDPAVRTRRLYNYDLYRITVSNNSSKPIKACQLRAAVRYPDGSEHRPAERHYISAPFNLAMGETVEKPFIQVPAGQYGSAAELVSAVQVRGQWQEDEIGAFKLDPGTYTVRLFAYSENAPCTEIALNLSRVDGKWELVEAGKELWPLGAFIWALGSENSAETKKPLTHLSPPQRR